MEIKKFDIGNKHVEFVNQSANTRNGFKHITTMFINGCRYAEHTVHYLNRTWECYRYQTCMRGCVKNELENQIKNLKSDFKFENNYKILNAKRREEFEEYIKDNDEVKFYNELLEKIGA